MSSFYWRFWIDNKIINSIYLISISTIHLQACSYGKLPEKLPNGLRGLKIFTYRL